jgi:DNA-binding response OmpR family regulator
MDELELKRNRAAVSIAMVDENVVLTNTLRSGFKILGYGGIELYRDVASLEVSLYGARFDLIIGDGDINGGKLLDLVRRLRNGEVGRNPFTAIIITSWSREWSMVRRAIDAGADDILANPIFPGRLMDRIKVIIEHRKPFIVTADYTGPDRRRDPSRASTIPAFWPPNSLAEKERGRYVNDEDLKWRIGVSTAEMCVEKLRRSVFQLAFLEGLAYLALHRDSLPAMTSEALAEILGQAQGMVGFAKANDKLDVVKDLAGVIRVAGDMISTIPTRTGFVALRRDIDRLLKKMFPTQSASATRLEVDLAIQGYEQRRQAKLEAVG